MQEGNDRVSPLQLWAEKNKRFIWIGALGIILVLPIFLAGSGLSMRIATLIFIYSLLTTGLMVITGYTGMLNMGHAAFYGMGAYASAILAVTFHQPFWICFLVSALAAGITGFIIAFPCLRVTTDFLSLITIAFAEVFLTIVLSWIDLTRGPMGIPAIPNISIAGFEFDTALEVYYLYFAIALISYISLHNILNSRIGRSFKAIRDDEICAKAQGINVRYYKVLAFTLGTIPAGIAGSLLAYYIQFVGPSMFSFETSLILMNMVILGGLGSLPGAVVGAAIFIVLTEIFRPLAIYRVGVGGATMVLLMLFRPQGIMGSAAYAGQGGFQAAIQRLRQRSSARSRLQKNDSPS